MAGAVREVRAVILPPLPRPDDEDVPEWSPETLEALNRLTGIERAFVENMATGDNQTEAYRKAKGMKDDDEGAKQYAYRFLSRPRVLTALHAAFKDMNFDARMNRAWILQRLDVALRKAEESSSGESAARVLDIIAKIKGEHLPPPPQEIKVTHEITPAAKRLLDALDLARKKSGVTVVSRAEANEVPGG